MTSLRARHRFLMLYSGFVRLLMRLALDEIPILRNMRGCLYSFGMASCGSNFQPSSDVILWGLEHMRFGRNVYLGPGVVIICLDRLHVGRNVLLGPHVVVSNGNHVFRDGMYRVGENETSPIHIGDGSWVGANSTIVAGVRIGKGALIGANSVVTKDVADYEIVGGVPAKVIGKRVV